MSNDNDPRDEAMREIEAAIGEYGAACLAHESDAVLIQFEQRLNALIRSKLPQPDAEHERAVEAWESEATDIALHCGIARDLVLRMRDEGVRLMRARPASGKDEAAGELLRAAKACWRFIKCEMCMPSCECYRCVLENAIAKAERAGIKP